MIIISANSFFREKKLWKMRFILLLWELAHHTNSSKRRNRSNWRGSSISWYSEMNRYVHVYSHAYVINSNSLNSFIYEYTCSTGDLTPFIFEWYMNENDSPCQFLFQITVITSFLGVFACNDGNFKPFWIHCLQKIEKLKYFGRHKCSIQSAHFACLPETPSNIYHSITKNGDSCTEPSIKLRIRPKNNSSLCIDTVFYWHSSE